MDSFLKEHRWNAGLTHEHAKSIIREEQTPPLRPESAFPCRRAARISLRIIQLQRGVQRRNSRRVMKVMKVMKVMEVM
jgi:hypothetical protein